MQAGDLTQERETELFRIIRNLAQLPGLMSDYRYHPWQGSKIESWSFEKQVEIGAHLNRLRATLQESRTLTESLADVMRVPAPNSQQAVRSFLELARVFCESPCPPEVWMDGVTIDELRRRATLVEETTLAYCKHREELSPCFSPAFRQLDCSVLDEVLNNRSSLDDAIRGTRYEVLPTHGELLERLTHEAAEALADLATVGAELAPRMGQASPTTLADYRRLSQIATLAALDPRPTETWFDWTALLALFEEVRGAQSKAARRAALRSALLEQFGESFYDLPLHTWRGDFAEKYQSMLRIFRPAYHKCRKLISSTRTTATTLSHVTVRKAIEDGSEVLDLNAWFAERREKHAQVLRFHYRGQETDWEAIVEHLQRVRAILEIDRGSPPAAPLAEALMAGGAILKAIGELGKQMQALLQQIEGLLRSLDEYLEVRALLASDSHSVGTLRSVPPCQYR